MTSLGIDFYCAVFLEDYKRSIFFRRLTNVAFIMTLRSWFPWFLKQSVEILLLNSWQNLWTAFGRRSWHSSLHSAMQTLTLSTRLDFKRRWQNPLIWLIFIQSTIYSCSCFLEPLVELHSWKVWQLSSRLRNEWDLITFVQARPFLPQWLYFKGFTIP